MRGECPHHPGVWNCPCSLDLYGIHAGKVNVERRCAACGHVEAFHLADQPHSVGYCEVVGCGCEKFVESKVINAEGAEESQGAQG